MAGVAQAYQHPLTDDRLPFAFRLTRRVAVCIVELFIGQVRTLFIALVQLSFIQRSR